MRSLRYVTAVGIAAALSVGAFTQLGGASPAAQAKVTIKGVEKNDAYVFSPVKKTVKMGTKVTWKDSSDAPHTVTSDTKSWTFDKKFDTSTSVSFTFKKAGTYKYHCAYHPGMVGTIVVKK